MTTRRLLGLEHLTLLDMAPPAFVTLAGACGFDTVGLRVFPASPGELPWPMTPGSTMLTETIRRCRDTGVTVLDVEALPLGPDGLPSDHEAVLESAARLGARYLNVIADDPDLGRLADQIGRLVHVARDYSVRPVIEFMAYKPVRCLADVVTVAERSAGAGILVDALHVQRCGTDLADLAHVDPNLLTYVQLCDAPRTAPRGLPLPRRMPRNQSPLHSDGPLEARTCRLLPGEGELPLAELLAVLPADLPVAVEAPHLDRIRALGPRRFAERARQSLDALLRPPVVRQEDIPGA